MISMELQKLEILERSKHFSHEQPTDADISVPFELDLFGRLHELLIKSTSKTVTLKDLAYPARQICDMICQLTIEQQRHSGLSVRCTKECTACCKYAAAISLAEAFAINERINSMPRLQRTLLLRTMAMTSRKIVNNPPELTSDQSVSDDGTQSSKQLVGISRWYTDMNLSCPWLTNRLCGLYTERPLVCREFMVTSSPVCCNPSSSGRKEIVHLPLKMAEVLAEVCGILTDTTPQTMFLPLTPVWCEEFAELNRQEFDTEETISILLDTISQHCAANTTLTVTCS